jgi:hypothetical protein
MPSWRLRVESIRSGSGARAGRSATRRGARLLTADQALWALLAAALLVMAIGLLRYRTLLNPLTISTVTDTGLTTLLPGVFAYHFLTLGKYSEADMVKTAALSGVYLVGIMLPYLSRGSGMARIADRLLGITGLNSPRIGRRFSVVKFGLLVAGGLLTFVALAVAGGGGRLWITEPRLAYLHYRSGAGQFWLLAAWFQSTAFLYYLWARRPRILELLALVGVFGVGALYLGSKAIILTVGVIAIVYYHFMVRPLGTLKIILSGIAGAGAFLWLLLFQGSYTDLIGIASYFENFQITAEFIGRFPEFGFQYGKGWLSSFWFYVPRALYPAKPLEYGPILIQKVLLPGAYEGGYAPGFLNWSLSYLDFGWLGVLGAGVLKGTVERAAYEQFLRNKNSLFAFAIMMQLSLWGVFAFASISIVVIWCWLQSLFLRLVLVHGTQPSHARPVET